MVFLRWLLQGAQRIVCPLRVFVPSGAWDVVPCSLRLWHLLRIPALLLRARCAHLDLQVLRLVLVPLRVSLRVFPLLFVLFFLFAQFFGYGYFFVILFRTCGSFAFYATGDLDSPHRVFEFCIPVEVSMDVVVSFLVAVGQKH